MTYAEVKQAEYRYRDAKRDYNTSVYDLLEQNIRDAGFKNVVVRVKKGGREGVLRVEESSYSYVPYEIKFYPLKKDGGVSLASRHVIDFFSSRALKIGVDHLKSVFEVCGRDES